MTYLLATHPEHLKKVTAEVRSAFNSPDEITLMSVSRLDYMLACIHETLRVYPPLGHGLVRETGAGGRHIAGEYVPPGTYIEVQPWAINHDSKNWTKPWEFNPERFLRFHENGKIIEAFQPFLNANTKSTTNGFGDHVEALQPFVVGVSVFLSYLSRLVPACLIFADSRNLSRGIALEGSMCT